MERKNIDISNINLLKGIWKSFKPIRKKQFFLCSLLMVISGISETLSLASIIPLISFLISPTEAWNNSIVNKIFSSLGFIDFKEPILPVVLIFVISVLVAGFLRIFTLWIISKYIAALGSDFSYESFRKNLYQPFSIHIDKNSSDIVALNTVEINRLSNIFTYFMKMLLSITYVVFIVIAIFIYDLKLGLTSFFAFIAIYFLLTYFSRFYLRRNSKFISKSLQKNIKFLNEGLGSIREIILNSNYKFYLTNFLKIDQPMRSKMAENDFISNGPKALVESIAFIYLALLSLFVVLTQSNSALLLTKIAVIAVACQKILPQLQQIYASWSRLSGNSKSVEKILKTINQPILEKNTSSNRKLRFKNYISLNDIYFKYKDSSNFILNKINLKINKAEKIGIIGETGAGKSTLVDVIIGLLKPTKGNIYVDNCNIYSHERINAMRLMIAYIPQNIYLSDSTIIENIAPGLKKEDIDKRKVIKSSQKAQIHNFIRNLPLGYDTVIGEMGMKLSGGQKQRLGIARAIFNIYDKDKNILILDEATSALDYALEELIIKSLYEIKKDLTLIMISHRYNTLRNCDRILKIKNGSILIDEKPEKFFKDLQTNL